MNLDKVWKKKKKKVETWSSRKYTSRMRSFYFYFYFFG